jgi:thiol-disulfide isomerase/thioredoxin
MIVRERKPALFVLSGLLIGVGLGVIILFGLGFGDQLFGGGKAAGGGSLADSPFVGSPAPDFQINQLGGQPVRLSDLKGKPVLINFWATWCGPCTAEMPAIQKIYAQYPSQFTVLAVNADEPVSDIKSFLKDKGLTFDILLDPGGKVQSLYRLRGYPTSFFLDADGIVRAEFIGPLSEGQLVDNLKKVGVGQ